MLRVSAICLLAGLSAATAAAGPEALRCDIRFERSGDRLAISGLVLGEPGLEGRYTLTAEIVDGSNRSVSSQGGRFAVGRRGAPAVVSRVSVLAAPRTRIEVELVLKTPDGNTSCRSSTI